MFRKILIANRGEIAVRIIRACRELGIKTVTVYSETDKQALHVKYADQAYCVGPTQSKKSYLNIPNILSVAKIAGVDAIHPGYGFLAENAYFAEMCSTYGFKFIGPQPKTIDLMGNKARAKELMEAEGISVIPGSKGAIENPEEALVLGEKIGYPIIVKASAGGGGKGMRIAQNEAMLKETITLAQSEAKAAFGDGEIYLEKYIEEPRHIEFQILADEHGSIVHLGERDCSLQRRHQKLIEEAPSIALSPELRKQMGEAAVRAAKAANYSSAGTIEFLLDKQNKFYFIEMNTRIQVEHGVTELVTGVDLVKEQIKIAAGIPLSIAQEEIRINGHCIECRINAEDPENDFKPSPGQVKCYHPSGGPGVRIDSSIYSGISISPAYDSMLAKLLVWGQNREEAIKRMERALDEFIIVGIKTTIPFHKRVLNNAFFRKGEVYTNFIQRRIMAEDK